MQAVLFPSDQAGALAMQAKLDAAYGCPVAGVDVGGGVHAPPEQSATIHYGTVLQHPTLKTNYATQVDGYDTSKLQPADKLIVDAAKASPDLTSDWFPAAGTATVEMP